MDNIKPLTDSAFRDAVVIQVIPVILNRFLAAEIEPGDWMRKLEETNPDNYFKIVSAAFELAEQALQVHRESKHSGSVS